MNSTTKKLIKEQGELGKKLIKYTNDLHKDQQKLDTTQNRLEQTKEKLSNYESKQKKLNERRKIFSHDVELDSLFTLLKVGLTLLVTYVLKEYLCDIKMELSKFLERLATLPARVRVASTVEIVTFEYDRRDPEIMNLQNRSASCASCPKAA